MKQKFTSLLLILTTLLGLAACGSQTQLYERWHDDTFSGQKLQKTLVIGVIKDDIRRRALESSFVAALQSKGTAGVAGYTLLSGKDTLENKEEIVAAVKKAGADSVLITSFKGVIEKERQVPPRVDYVPTVGRYGRYGYGYRGYYGSRYEAVYQPGYTTTDTIVQLETRVYSAVSEKLIWAGKTKSINVSSADKIIKELVSVVVDDMKKNGLLQ